MIGVVHFSQQALLAQRPRCFRLLNSLLFIHPDWVSLRGAFHYQSFGTIIVAYSAASVTGGALSHLALYRFYTASMIIISVLCGNEIRVLTVRVGLNSPLMFFIFKTITIPIFGCTPSSFHATAALSLIFSICLSLVGVLQ